MALSPRRGGALVAGLLALSACSQPADSDAVAGVPDRGAASGVANPTPARRPAATASAADGSCADDLTIATTGLLADGADLLSDVDERALEARLADAAHRSRATIIVATVPRLDDQPVEVAARCLSNRWTVNGKPVQHGALILLAPNNRRIRIATMPGTQRVLTDTRAARVIGKMTRSFRNGDYADGLAIGVADLSAAFAEDERTMPAGGAT